MTEKFSRLGIFVFFDAQGIVDAYILHLLKTVRPNFTKLVVVCNGEIRSDQRTTLEAHCDALFTRENRGLDAAAFKAGLLTFCGWEEVEQYDEIVLFNDTFYGPIHSFDAMFSAMEQKDVDFWGISAGYESLNSTPPVKYGYVPDYIQTFFVAFRKKMVCSGAFHDYWEKYNDNQNEYLEVVTQHELAMTKHFQDLQFRWDIYADSERYRSDVRSENFNLYLTHSYRLMKDMNFPVFKKKVLSLNIPEFLYLSDLEEPAMAMEYIQNCTDYDSNLIWDNAIRIYNPADLFNSLHLTYVLPSCPADDCTVEDAALVFYLSNPFFAAQFCARANQLAQCINVYILPKDEAMEQSVLECLGNGSDVTVLKATGQDTEMGSLVLGCKDIAEKHAYFGFVHDLQNPNHDPTSVCESTVFGYLQNIANDGNYIRQVLRCFEKNPRLGILGAPFPIHHHGFGTYGNGWDTWYAATGELARELDLHCSLCENKPPVMLTGVFWCRSNVLKPLWRKDWQPCHFHQNAISQISQTNEVLKRILPFAAQSEGYYSGIVMHTDYASMRITVQQHMLDAIIPEIRRQHPQCYSEHFHGFLQQLRNPSEKMNLRAKLRVWTKKYIPKQLGDQMLNIYRAIKHRLKR